MPRHLACIAPLLAAPLLFAQPAPSPARIVGETVPGVEWQQTSPQSVGYSSTKLEALRAWLKTEGTTAMMVVVQGQFITILPAKDMVVVHKVDIDVYPHTDVSDAACMAMLTIIADANCDNRCK